MSERYTLKQGLFVRASMFTADELRRQKRLGLDEINENVLAGLVAQRANMEAQQNSLIRSLAFSLFLAFVAANGGDIGIPGTGASLAEIPAFLELSLIAAAFSVLMVTYSFLSIQTYNAVITTVASEILAKNKLDADIFLAAQSPMWLFLKFARKAPVNGRMPGYRISKLGQAFYSLLVSSLAFIIFALWLLAISSIVYMAHSALPDSTAGWTTYSICITLILASFVSMAADVIEFEHEMDFSALESMEVEEYNHQP